ncbi:DUF4367 domain-containing protein [Hornefia butyriciproducens]|uniref:DUF4367 domain-containing protein n=1 Tax=Hornefia butyriciproducens TaxID=2652293 RepID=UPI0023F1447B|nr:DUF4367 domain-containing protein [Hornefia butyriciproducens]MDD6298554.1 DUF4367 domain-containing protein [Hornefia butyriciproducens]MDY5422983.1 DUF4367 domain-containing protein [Hornefia butyriciproducens]
MNDVREAMLQVYAEEFQQLKDRSEEQPEHQFSRRFKRRIRRAERLAERRVRTMRPKLRVRRAALVILLVAALMATSILAFALVRPTIFTKILKGRTEWHVSYRQEDPDGLAKEFRPVKPETPEGYTISEEIKNDPFYDVIYKDGNNKEIIYSQYTVKNAKARWNSEDTTLKKMKINGYEGYGCYRERNWCLYWNNGYYAFELSGNCKLSVLMKMAETLE